MRVASAVELRFSATVVGADSDGGTRERVPVEVATVVHAPVDVVGCGLVPDCVLCIVVTRPPELNRKRGVLLCGGGAVGIPGTELANLPGLGEPVIYRASVELRAVLVDWGGVLDDRGDPPQGVAPVLAAVRSLRARGISTALVSNADTTSGLPVELFDVLAVSGAVGSAKPDEEIYRFAARELHRWPRECVFVDDSRTNVDTAVRLGMVGVRHVTPARTREELEVLFPLA